MRYNIGDIITPKYHRHKEWPDRLIIGCDSDDDCNEGYLWGYVEDCLNNNEIKTSLNHSDPEFNIYLVLKHP